VTARKQISMVLPVPLIAAIKERAQQRGQSITAYISALARADLQQSEASDTVLAERLQQLEDRLTRLERELLPAEDTNR
jgi:hypothetical protein